MIDLCSLRRYYPVQVRRVEDFSILLSAWQFRLPGWIVKLSVRDSLQPVNKKMIRIYSFSFTWMVNSANSPMPPSAA